MLLNDYLWKSVRNDRYVNSEIMFVSLMGERECWTVIGVNAPDMEKRFWKGLTGELSVVAIKGE